MHTFNVALEPISVLGQEVKGKKAVVRTDTKDTLGIVSDNYKIITHGEALGAIEKALGKKVEPKVTIAKNGALMFATYTLKDVQGEVAKGDIVGMQFTAINSYDGTTTLRISLGGLRLVCLNGMVVSDHFYRFSIRHTGEAQIEVAKLAEKMEGLTESFQKSLKYMKAMTETRLKGGEAAIFDQENTKLPSYLIDAAQEEYQRAGDESVWGGYNALTYAITHSMRRESPQTAIRYGRIAWASARALV